jgi:protein-S-isoprenylcysteine O-methyltransferase Ste14
MKNQSSLTKKVLACSSIVFFLVMALEVMIMISPFAFFFYSVFSPVFNFLGQHTATRWTIMFFLPHMILPPTLFLKTVRVAGSIFFLAGFFTFCFCALQVYLGKIFHWGIADRGLYKYIRHPQYLALGIWGIGMAILWPRFIVLVTLAIMFVLYYFLARDEERRMLKQYGASYQQYLDTRGMFFPRSLERPFDSAINLIPTGPFKSVAIPALIIALVMGSGFGLRAITLASLPLTANGNLTLVPILPEDGSMEGKAISGILNGASSGSLPFFKADKDYLGYIMPPDYIMQGMIADTGGHSHLFKQHHTVALIVDWVLHPFGHLRRPPAAQMAAMQHIDPKVARRHHCPVGIDQADLDCDSCPYRRVILVEMGSAGGKHISGAKLLAGSTTRTPVGFVDLDTRTGELVKVSPVGKGTAWKDVPTPEI